MFSLVDKFKLFVVKRDLTGDFIFTVFVLSSFFVFGLTLGPACLFNFLVLRVNSRSLLFIAVLFSRVHIKSRLFV